MATEQFSERKTLMIVAPFKGDAISLGKLLGDIYPVQAHHDLASLSIALGESTGLVILTEESLSGDVLSFGNALDRQPGWSEIPVILLASNKGRSGRDTEMARRRLPKSAGHVIVLERPLSSSSLLSAIAAAWRARERQFEMRQSLTQLAEERTRLQILLENIPVGVCFMDTQGTSLVSNPLYRQYVPENVIPSRQTDGAARWVGLDAQGQRLEPDMFPGARALRGDAATGVDFYHRRDAGRESWMRVSAVPLYDEKHHIIGAASVIVDINDEKQAELNLRRFNEELEIQVKARTQELNAAVEQLKAESEERARAEEQLRQSLKMEAVGQLTGGIAHDFNNMLTGVIGSLDLIKLRMASGRLEGVERFMDAALISAQRAASLTDRLLAFSRRQSLDEKAVSVNNLITALADLLQKTVTEKIIIKFDLSPEDPWVFADANQLENAVLNLVINARDAMPHGGGLTIATCVEQEAQDEPLRHVCVQVRDTGHGIPKDMLDKVTEPFFTTKPIGQGTGLGLSMVYGFANQSNGRLSIESTIGVGTTVSICLPKYKQVESDPPFTASEFSTGQGQVILLVEDDDSVRLINQEVLEELGYRVHVARDGEEALRVFNDLEKVDFLLTDVGLPGMNGRQLAEILQQLSPRLPVLFLTGYAEGALTRADFLGPYMQLLTKPFTLESLAIRVASMLEGDVSAVLE
ncbi:Histidine kinase-response regulator hybrid protein [Pseudomonas amygdali pv. eriobotryae]|uniref:histidine kinase n=3 Tax=Pseudomonas syringae group TaxID=136849 RepID=A0A0P9TDQ1_PSEA0|nr:ATP-binding protein [Pseudomonas amygdali]KPX38803.1 Histidine kinase-response regulator hybrid protein [Pseudomonas amygdali pv. eriobotryae]KWS77773.1 hybrid sensor histidine kinase/response regulator [Pseudomonas amygdali pv. eriobotryae]RML96816.1 Histidine kinase-response regulator hybrid protein [Pseudomonas amygdali pv. eriobotryae]RMO63240.1 Histidine kinase-response regulator hybrid protein [Pseudomonas amygdali pv. eriobotryae]GFZ58489.1 hybrid sensor histidine kinase/response reg